jgi:hypothetical protein
VLVLLPTATEPKSVGVSAAALGTQASRRTQIDRQQKNAFSTHRRFFPDAEHSVVWLDCGIAVSAVTAASILESGIGHSSSSKHSAALVCDWGRASFSSSGSAADVCFNRSATGNRMSLRHTLATLTTAAEKVCREDW